MARKPRLLTQRAAAAHLGVNVQTLRKAANSGNGPPRVKLGKRMLYPLTMLNDWIESGAV